ncbi:MAG: hypothetical protein QOE90_2995 [Thermoplasmata archaeon]|nr:hypothetical protein [Thermoplasmata archaeon]
MVGIPVLRMSQVIRRPVKDVFEAVIHVERFPEWNPRNPSARRLSEGAIAQGASFELEIKGFGKVRQTLEEFERDARVRIVPHMRALEGGHRFVFTAQGGQTRIDHELEMRPQGAFRLMTPMMWLVGKKNLRETARHLQRHLEGP